MALSIPCHKILLLTKKSSAPGVINSYTPTDSSRHSHFVWKNKNNFSVIAPKLQQKFVLYNYIEAGSTVHTRSKGKKCKSLLMITFRSELWGNGNQSLMHQDQRVTVRTHHCCHLPGQVKFSDQLPES
jgi:hypothetical protein